MSENYSEMTAEQYHNETVCEVGDALDAEMDEHDTYAGSNAVFEVIRHDIVGENRRIARVRVKPNPNTTSDESPYVASFYAVGEEEVAVYCDQHSNPDHAFLGHGDDAEAALQRIVDRPVSEAVDIDGVDWFLPEIEQ